MASAEVNVDKRELVWKCLYPLKPKSYVLEYEVVDRVRIAMQKRPFSLGDWSQEIF